MATDDITLSALARQLKQGFQEMSARFDAAERRLDEFVEYANGEIALVDDKLEEKIGTVHERLDGVEARFDRMDRQLARVEDNQTDMTEQLTGIDRRLSVIGESLADHAARIKRIERRAGVP
jgi:chromosome segregation ATPase